MTYKVLGETEKKGVKVWPLQIITEQKAQGMKTIYTQYLDKNTFELVWWRMEVYQNDKLIMSQEGGPTQQPSGTTGTYSPSPPKAEYEVGTETITVPAGTFTCTKFKLTTTYQGRTSQVTSWHSAEVPIYGLVKSVVYTGGQKTTEMVLVEYSS